MKNTEYCLSEQDVSSLRTVITDYVNSIKHAPTGEEINQLNFSTIKLYINELNSLYSLNDPIPLINTLTTEFTKTINTQYNLLPYIEQQKKKILEYREQMKNKNISKLNYDFLLVQVDDINRSLYKFNNFIDYTNFNTTTPREFENSFNNYVLNHKSLHHIFKNITNV